MTYNQEYDKLLLSMRKKELRDISKIENGRKSENGKCLAKN